jgi:ubiquinone/menaquinone biosynthesis C-methylase UbiE
MWLGACCQRWQAEPALCFGVDLIEGAIETARRNHPQMNLRCIPAEQMDYDDESFDLVHQSMMFSSVPGAEHRRQIAGQMWRILRRGGYLLSNDFWINPLNRAVVGIRMKELRRLFPAARLVQRRTITVAPPLARVLERVSDRLALGVERLRVFNTHHLALFTKP